MVGNLGDHSSGSLGSWAGETFAGAGRKPQEQSSCSLKALLQVRQTERVLDGNLESLTFRFLAEVGLEG